MTQKTNILFKIINTVLLFFAFIEFLRTFSYINLSLDSGFGWFSIIYLSKSILSISIFISVLGLIKFKKWARVLLFISLFLFFTLGHLSEIIFLSSPTPILIVIQLIILTFLALIYFNPKSNLYFNNKEARILENKPSKIADALNKDITSWINIVLFSISGLLVLWRIMTVFINLLKMQQLCPNEAMSLKIYSIPFIALVLVGIGLFLSSKYKRGKSVVLFFNILLILLSVALTSSPFTYPRLTKTKEECARKSLYHEWFIKKNSDVCSQISETSGFRGRDDCFKHTGIYYNNHNLCNQIVDEEDKDWCNIVVESNINNANYKTFCKQFTGDSLWRCYSRFRETNNDCSICNELTDSVLRRKCGPNCR